MWLALLLISSSATGVALALVRLRVFALIPATNQFLTDHDHRLRRYRPSMGCNRLHRDCQRHNAAVLLPDRGTCFRGFNYACSQPHKFAHRLNSRSAIGNWGGITNPFSDTARCAKPA